MMKREQNSSKGFSMNFRKFLAVFAMTVTPMLATAQEVGECDWRSSARNIGEPWADNTRTFSNGKTRLALLDTIEPAAGSIHLLIISPPYDELGSPQCKVISHFGSVGFTGLEFSQLEASYDPSTGLTFVLPGAIYNPDNGSNIPTFLGLTLNRAPGVITTEMAAGG